MASELARFMAAVRAVESGGDYRAVGPLSRYGRPTGAYQFLRDTWGNFRGYRDAADAPPAVQDQRARQLMAQYHRELGRWDLVAVAWHAGPGVARRVKDNPAALNGIGDGYVSTRSYVARVLGRARLDGHGKGSRRPEHVELRPWQVPRGVTGRAGTIVVDPDLLHRISRQLTDQLATVESAYHRCRQIAADVGRIRVADPRLDRRLECALDEALEDWQGLRRLAYLYSRDIGYVVQARHRALRADDGNDRRERATVERLVGSLAGGHTRRTRRQAAELLRALFRPDGDSPHLRRHLPTTRAPDPRPGGSGRGLASVEVRGAWAGTQSIFTQFVTPFMRRLGLTAGSQKRDYNTGSGRSDHYIGSRRAYAVDYPTYRGGDEARKLARAMGISGWRPNTYQSFFVRVDGHRFRVQILWGDRIDHGDHVHVGIKRV